MDNIFVTRGHEGLPKVSSLLDWEFHAFLPPKLAARIPEWLQRDGFFNPHFSPVGSSFSWYWEELPDIAQELRDAFLAAINKSHSVMFAAYEEGALARQVSDWLDHWSDDVCYRSSLSAWIQHVNDLASPLGSSM